MQVPTRNLLLLACALMSCQTAHSAPLPLAQPGFFDGIGNSLKETANGLVSIAKDPIGALRNMNKAVSNPVETGKAFVANGGKNCPDVGTCLGYVTGAVGTFAATSGAGAAASAAGMGASALMGVTTGAKALSAATLTAKGDMMGEALEKQDEQEERAFSRSLSSNVVSDGSYSVAERFPGRSRSLSPSSYTADTLPSQGEGGSGGIKPGSSIADTLSSQGGSGIGGIKFGSSIADMLFGGGDDDKEKTEDAEAEVEESGRALPQMSEPLMAPPAAPPSMLIGANGVTSLASVQGPSLASTAAIPQQLSSVEAAPASQGRSLEFVSAPVAAPPTGPASDVQPQVAQVAQEAQVVPAPVPAAVPVTSGADNSVQGVFRVGDAYVTPGAVAQLTGANLVQAPISTGPMNLNQADAAVAVRVTPNNMAALPSAGSNGMLGKALGGVLGEFGLPSVLMKGLSAHSSSELPTSMRQQQQQQQQQVAEEQT